MLINGINITEIRKLRFKDVKYATKQILLKKPRRKVMIDTLTNQLLVDYLNRNLNNFDGKNDKIFKYTERAISHFISRYSSGCGFEVTSTILNNSFWLIHIKKFPEWTVLDYSKHLGYNSLDYTQEKFNFWLAEYKRIKDKIEQHK